MNRNEGFNECWKRLMTDIDARQVPDLVAIPLSQSHATFLIGSELAYMNDILGRIVLALEKNNER